MTIPTLTGVSGFTPPSLADKLSDYNDLVLGVLHDLVRPPSGLDPFYGMMSYHLGWVDEGFRPRHSRGGKSLRPSLCMLIGDGLGASPQLLAGFAAGLELLHNFSLVHDDIQDQSYMRRNRPAVWSLWGAAQAINVGDAMFSLAHVSWLRSELAEQDPAAFVAIVRSIEATILRLCEGQYLDMDGERSLDMTTDLYLRMIGRKTAALIGESAWVGARAGGASDPVLDATRQFGADLGLAFQIRDDLLGIWGDEDETGKSASSDISARKMTFPIIAALEYGSDDLRDELRSRYATAPVDGDETLIRGLLDAAGARQITSEFESRHWVAAMRALESLPLDAVWRQHIHEFARMFVGRRS